MLSVEERGGRADPAMAERHATARLLYDQAHTAAAMVEVRRIADEGLALATEPEGVATPVDRERRGKGRRKAGTAREERAPRVRGRRAR